MVKTTVVNMRHEDCDVPVARGLSRWGNPFKIGVHGTRTEVIALYEEWLLCELEDPDNVTEFLKLRGKKLGCWCKPKRCHGDIILKHLERLSSPLLRFT